LRNIFVGGAAVTYDSIYWAPPLDVQGAKLVNAKGYVVQLKALPTMGGYPNITKGPDRSF